MLFALKIIGGLALILLTVSGIIYSDKGYTPVVKFFVRIGIFMSCIYMAFKLLPDVVVVFEILLRFSS